MVNPYESNPSNAVQLPASADNHRPRTLQGLFWGGIIPFVLGTILLVQFRMSLPVLQPGEVHCGTGALGPVCIILLGSPFGALIGAIAGSTLRRL